MKYLVLGLTESPYEIRYLARFYEKSKDLGIDSYIYYYTHGNLLPNVIPKEKIIINKKLNDYLISKDHRFYDDFLALAHDNASKAVIPRLIHPEFLYSSIECLNNCPEISLSGYAFELFIRSKSRSNIVQKILEFNNVKGLFLHTIGGPNAKWPPELKVSNFVLKKIRIDTEPLFDSLDKYIGNKTKAKKDLFLEKYKKIILFFGSMYSWKGPDTLLDSIENISEECHIIFAGNLQTYKGDLDRFKDPRITLINKPDDNQMYKLFHSSDMVICPYGPTYSYGTSSVCMSSILSGKPVVCPSIEPFISVINNFKCGEIYTLNDSLSLAAAINKIFSNLSFNESNYNNMVKEFIQTIVKWEDILHFHIN